MKRINIVYDKLVQISSDQGVDAQTLSNILNISRANVSFDLNRLWKEGMVKKTNGRPVLYSAIVAGKPQNITKETGLDILAKNNESLKEAIDQAKAAILYPPKGMHCLILGDTGVGKSMFADLMHTYAIEMGIKKENSPFIVFNCADYSNNPQLLTAQLFGVKKGAFTGADCDKTGLIEKAHNGILFLDEVHRLPPEGQEAFFTFMDKGSFRKVGETNSITADVLIISATTEDPSSCLLKTFTRRIPMTIRIPSLEERTTDERLSLIKTFFQNESLRLNKDISVSLNTMRALLSYNCPNNIGQLRGDIQLICAKAYSYFLTNKKEDLKVNTADLPLYIKEGLYTENTNRIIWNKTLGQDINFFKFSKGKNENLIENREGSIYDIIDRRVLELKEKSIPDSDIEIILKEDVTKYFQKYINSNTNDMSRKNLLSILGPDTLKLMDKIFSYASMSLKRNLSANTFSTLALHINSLIERLINHKKIINPQLNYIKKHYPVEFEVAEQCVKIIESHLDIPIPSDEAGFITLLLVSKEKQNHESEDKVKVLLVAHGNSTATSMADVANKLLGENYVIGINAPIEVSPLEILASLKAFIKNDMNSKGYLLLVDMGSLTTFGDVIENEFKIPIKVIPLVSTLHVIEATRKALLGLSLEELYSDVLSINSYLCSNKSNQNGEGVHPKFAIVTACLTGEGSSVAIKSFLKNNLKYDNNIFDIIPINSFDKQLVKTKLSDIEKEREILFIVSSFPIDCDIEQYSVDDVISLRVMKELQEKIDVKTTLIRMGSVLSENIENIDGRELFNNIVDFLNNIEGILNIHLKEDALPGIILHIGFMIDRVKKGNFSIVYEESEEFINEYIQVYNAIQESLEFFQNKYAVTVPKDEVCYIMNFFIYPNE